MGIKKVKISELPKNQSPSAVEVPGLDNTNENVSTEMVALVNTLADAKLLNLLKHIGAYDASTNQFPSTEGSGTGGAILRGNLWNVSVSGTLEGVIVDTRVIIIALVNSPGQTLSNWFISASKETTQSILSKIGDGSQIGSQYLPSYVDDVIEVADYASLPGTGEQGKIYVTIDDNASYRWSGSAYVSLSNPLDYVTQPEVETANPAENTKVTTILRVFQGFVHWAANTAFPALDTTTKTLIGAINEALKEFGNGLTESEGVVGLGGAFDSDIEVDSDGHALILKKYEVGLKTGAGFNGSVASIVSQNDGKILVGGSFTSYSSTPANRIIRLNSDGAIDTAFDYGNGFDGNVNAVVLLDDGKILIGGNFSSYKGTNTNCIIRLNSNGTIDDTFDYGQGFNGDINSIQLQGDDKILVGGLFTSYQGISANRIIRLHSDGTIDSTFDYGDGFSGSVRSIVLQGDGEIFVGGYFFSFDDSAASRIIRLNSNGTIDDTFDYRAGFDRSVTIVALQADSKILVGGYFTSYNSTPANRIIRLHSDGTIDDTFDYGDGFDGIINSIVLQDDGKILIGGNFTSYNSTPANRIIRLHSDGSIDDTFDYGDGFDGIIYSIILQDNSKVLIGGVFTTYKSTTANRLACLKANGTLNNEDKEYGVRITGTGVKEEGDYCSEKTDFPYVTKQMLLKPPYKSGATQSDSGAPPGWVWVNTNDNSVKMGV